MAGDKKDIETDYRIVNIKTTDGATVRGEVNIAPRKRVSELFNVQKGPFVVMVSACSGEVTDKTLFINKDHIVWVEPDD